MDTTKKLKKIMRGAEEYLKTVEPKKTSGNTFFKSGNISAARDIYDRVVSEMTEIFIRSDKLLMNLKNEEDKKAVEPFLEEHKKIFTEIGDFFTVVSSNLVLVEFKLGNYKKGVEVSTQALLILEHYKRPDIDETPKILKLTFRRCMCSVKIDDVESALDDIDKCLSFQPKNKEFLILKRKIKAQEKRLNRSDKRKYKNMFSKLREIEESDYRWNLDAGGDLKKLKQLTLNVLEFFDLEYERVKSPIDFFGYFKNERKPVCLFRSMRVTKNGDVSKIPMMCITNINLEQLMMDYETRQREVYAKLQHVQTILWAPEVDSKTLEILSESNHATLKKFTISKVKKIDNEFVDNLSKLQALETLIIKGGVEVTSRKSFSLGNLKKLEIFEKSVTDKDEIEKLETSSLLSCFEFEKMTKLKFVKYGGVLRFKSIEKLLKASNLEKFSVVLGSSATFGWFKILTSTTLKGVSFLGRVILFEESDANEWYKSIRTEGMVATNPTDIMYSSQHLERKNSVPKRLVFENTRVECEHFIHFIGLSSLRYAAFVGECGIGADFIGALQQLACEVNLAKRESKLLVDFSAAEFEPKDRKKWYQEYSQHLFSTDEVRVII